MNKLLKQLSISTLIVTVFYHPLIKLFNYVENNGGINPAIIEEDFR